MKPKYDHVAPPILEMVLKFEKYFLREQILNETQIRPWMHMLIGYRVTGSRCSLRET